LQKKITNILQQNVKIIKEQKKLAKEIKVIDQQLEQLPIELQQEQKLPYHWLIFNRKRTKIGVFFWCSEELEANSPKYISGKMLWQYYKKETYGIISIV